MKTINKCSIFRPEIEQILLENNITNGLGGEGANLDSLINTIIREAKDFIDINKVNKLYKDIYRLHFLHDIQFLVLSSKLEFYFANYIFVRDLGKLLHWLPWYKRKAIQTIVFVILIREGKKYSKHITI